MLDPMHANLLLKIEIQSDDDRRAQDEQVGLLAYAIVQLGHDLSRLVRSLRRRARSAQPAPAPAPAPAPVVPHCRMLLSK